MRLRTVRADEVPVQASDERVEGERHPLVELGVYIGGLQVGLVMACLGAGVGAIGWALEPKRRQGAVRALAEDGLESAIEFAQTGIKVVDILSGIDEGEEGSVRDSWSR